MVFKTSVLTVVGRIKLGIERMDLLDNASSAAHYNPLRNIKCSMIVYFQ